MHVLVWPGGTEIGLEIQKSLAQCKDIKLSAAGTDISNHAPFIYERYFVVPHVQDDGWLEALNDVIGKEGVDYIFPAHDDVVYALARNRDRVACTVVSSPEATCITCRSKSATYKILDGRVPIPRIYESATDELEYPLFLKPDVGQGSADTHIVSSKTELDCLLTGKHNYLILEYLPGRECTVDCFTDRERGLLFYAGRERVRTRSGIAMCTRSLLNPLFETFSRTISDVMPLYGAWFFQLKEDLNGEYRLLEVGPRIAGTMAFHRVQGVNFPLLSLYEHKRIPIRILTTGAAVELDRALINRYCHDITYNTVYIDLDDTLIIDDRVNTAAIQLLYQCVNRNKRIILLTKHDGEVMETLRKHRILELFDEIIHIDKNALKCDYIFDRDAIFVDDSFAERACVSDRVSIPTFDCSMIEMLLVH